MFKQLMCYLPVWAFLSSVVAGVSPEDLEKWYGSTSGLAMAPAEAHRLAQETARPLTLSGVDVSTLNALKNAMADPSGLDLGLTDIQKNVVHFAEQHISPDKLKTLFDTLTSSYTLHGGLGYSKDKGQWLTLRLAVALADVEELKAIYQVQYGYSGLGFKQNVAQDTSVRLAEFGVDAATYKETYLTQTKQGKSVLQAMDIAFDESVKADLQGLVKRYAKDGKSYTAAEFQQYYTTNWYNEWQAAPLEKRLSTDRKAYTANQFSRHFGGAWASKYRASKEATQLRLADDGKTYTMQDFQGYYHDDWQQKWWSAPELPCQECKPYERDLTMDSKFVV